MSLEMELNNHRNSNCRHGFPVAKPVRFNAIRCESSYLGEICGILPYGLRVLQRGNPLKACLDLWQVLVLKFDFKFEHKFFVGALSAAT